MTLERLNAQCNKAMPFVTPIGVVLGLLLGSRLAPFKGLSTLFFAIITFVGALGISYRQFVRALRNFKHIVVCAGQCSHLASGSDKAVVSWCWRPGSDNRFQSSSRPFRLQSPLSSGVPSLTGTSLALSLILLDTLLSPLITH